MSATTKPSAAAAAAPPADACTVQVVNAIEGGLLLPGVGPVVVEGQTCIGIRHGTTCIALPGSHAIDLGLMIAEATVAETGSMDRALLERLIARATNLRLALAALLEDGVTHELTADDGLLARYLQ